MEKRVTSGKGEPIPSILKKPKGRHKGHLLDKKSKIKREKVEGLKKGDVAAPLPQGCTPLMYACQQADYKSVVDILNKDPSSIRVRDRGLRCALHYCASSGGSTSQAARAACADRVLMAAPALADARDADGLTPLHLAVVHGNVPLVQALLAAGADVNARDDEHHTVVHWATVCGEVGALRAVLAAGADAATPDQHGGYPLHYAAQMCGAPAANDHQSRGAALEVLRALVREGGARVDVRDADGRTPLLWAASAGSAAAVLALNQAGAKVDDADRDGLTALHCAAARGHTEALETLVGLCGAKVDVADTHGCTPLHYAAALGHADATAALLDHGADSHRQDRKGRSPAHTAAAKGQIETVRILGARGANLWLRNSKGDLPLHEAVASGRRELVKWLLDGRPSQVNATNHEGRTPLHIAAATDNADLCRLLMDRGAEANLVARSSKNEPLTPLDCATSRGHRSTAKYIQMQGGLPATKLSNTQIVIDNASITALPTRKVTSTKIDVRDRIRIEKREVVEISTPVHEKHRAINKNSSESSNRSSSDSRKDSRKKYGNKHTDKHRERRKKLLHVQKSFSDGYDTELDGNTKETYENKKYKGSKKNRSKSEPSRRHKSSPRYRRHYYRSDSESSSDSESYTGKKKSKKHKRTKRKCTSTSESSSSESTERRSTKRKGKKTSIHIENDEKKQTVNIVKYKSVDPTNDSQHVQMNDKEPSSMEDAADTIQVEQNSENQTGKSKVHSETETDTLSLKTNMVVTEAQIHMERQSSQQGNSEITVTLDSLNNVLVETSNVNINNDTKEDEQSEPDKIESNKTVTPIEMKQGKIEDAVIDSQAASSPEVSSDLALEKCKISNKESNKDQFEKENAGNEAVPEINASEIEVEPEEKYEENADQFLKSKSDGEKDSEVTEGTQGSSKTAESSLTQDNVSKSPSPNLEAKRKRSFQILSGPDESPVIEKNISADLKTSLDVTSLEQTESHEKSISPSVSFANKDEIFESKDSGRQVDHLMGEKVEHDEGDISKSNFSRSPTQVEQRAEDKRNVYTTSTSSSGENVDKGLLNLFNETVSSDDRAVQQVILENISEGLNVNLPLSQPTPKQTHKTSRDSQGSSRKGSIYETESYKVLSDGINAGILKKSNKHNDNILEDKKETLTGSKHSKEESIYGRVPSVSDNEIYSHTDEVNGRRKRFRKKGRSKSRTAIRSKSENSERGYESSGLMDSGFEPSPRALHRRITSPRLVAYYQQRNASGRFSGKSDSRIPIRKPGDKYAVDMKSVTQRIQTNMRRYYCERKIFQHLLELKRLQIRTSKANEAVLVKRAIDEYNKSSLASVGLGPYNNTDFSFSSFEKFLYESLRKLQKSGKKHLDKLPERPIDFDYGESELYKMSAIPDNPCLCTSKTHRCFHAVHAYTGVPCAAYIPFKWDHHTMPKPATAGPSTRTRGFLPKINSKPSNCSGKAHVTLEVSHGTEKQLIALPAEKLDKNKRYYVTFTVKGSEPTSDNDNPSPSVSLKNKSI